MTPQLISIYALVAMFVVATLWPINMGVLAFVGAFLVGTLFAGQKTAEIIDGFPGGLFLTLVGITWLFALAQNNGTIDWLVRLAVRAVKGRIPLDQRNAVISAMWEIALADGHRSAAEDSAVRLAAKLLGVNDVDSALARQDVERSLASGQD